MKSKWVILAALAAFFVLFMHLDSVAVDTRDIDNVREKPVLDTRDFQIIDDFVAEAVQELVRTKDFASIAQTRSAILARSSSKKSSAQPQYAEQFSKSALKHISSAFEQAQQLESQDRKFKVVLNLLILIDGLEDVQLADLAVVLLKDRNTVIRYWAVHSVTNSGFTKALNSVIAANLPLARRIIDRLQELVEPSGPEILVLMAEFAAEVGIPQGEDLLVQIADKRIKKYADWKVDYELLDAAVLKHLDKKFSSATANKAAVARRFGQLFSYVIQRYVKGRDFLNATQRNQLASVMIETEKSSISKLLGVPQTVIKRSVERDDYTRLLLEHSKLLGDETRAGLIPIKLNFNYGQNPNGNARTAPLKLPEPPEKPEPPEE